MKNSSTTNFRSASPVIDQIEKRQAALRGFVTPANPAPVKRQYLQQDVTVKSKNDVEVEDGPAGPSPDTVLNDVSGINVSGRKPQLPSQSGRTSVSSVRDTSGRASVGPARNRALQAALQSSVNRQYAGDEEEEESSPSDGIPLPSFEDELLEIGKINERELAVKKDTKDISSRSVALGQPADNGADDDEEDLENSGTATGKPIYVPYSPDVRNKLHTANGVAQKPMVLRDYQILAEACQRAGRARMEGHAYYKIAELLSKNKRDTLSKSVSFFKKYLNISRRLNDLQGEAKALNCLGIVHYELGGMDNYQISLEYHKQHTQIADAAGIFIANTNMGLVHSRMGSVQTAVECHKQALQYAVRAGDKAAESLALANLGQSGAKQGDLTTARVCVERHLELATNLRDPNSSCEAYEQLGVLASQRNDFVAASENFLLALDVAIRMNDQGKAKHLRCQVGYAQGMLKMEEQMKSTASRMGTPV